jgi:uncharacterized protein involved in outer membrane biogenesis
MRRWVWILLALVVAAAGALGYAAVNLDRYLTDNREAFAERASTALGRKVSFESVDITFGRGLAVALAGVAVGDDPRFSAESFLEAEHAIVRVRVLPALFGRYEISSVLLEAPDLAIIRTSDGLNVATLGTGREASGDKASEDGGAAVAVALIDVEDGRVVYTDRTVKPPRETVIDSVDLGASDWSAGESFRFELAAMVLEGKRQNLKASGAVGPLDSTGGNETPLDVVAQLDGADAKALAKWLPPGELRASGPLHAKLHAGGTLASPTLDLSVDASEANVAFGTSFDKPAEFPFIVSGNATRSAEGVVRLDEIALALGGATLHGSGKLTPSRDSYAYAIDVAGTAVSLGGFERVLPALASAGVRGNADVKLALTAPTLGAPQSIDGTISLEGFELGTNRDAPTVSHLHSTLLLDGRAVSMPRAELHVVGAPATLELSTPDLYSGRLHFVFSTPKVALADLGVSGAADGDTLERVQAAGRLASTASSIDMDADLRAERGAFGGVAISNLVAKVQRRGGRLEISPLTLDACDGRLIGDATYVPASTKAPSRFGFDGRLEKMSIARLAISLTGIPSPLLEGKLDLAIDAEGSGDDWSSIRNALSGTGRIDLQEGMLRNVNLAESTLTGITGAPGLAGLLPESLRKDFPLLFATKDTRFDALSAALQITGGRVATRDLAMKARDFLIRGDGTVGLDGTVDLAAVLVPSVELSRRLVEQASLLKHLVDASGRVALPFKLAGTLPGAKPSPDLSALTGALGRGLIEGLGERLLGGEKKQPDGKKKRTTEAPASETPPPPGSPSAAPPGAAE